MNCSIIIPTCNRQKDLAQTIDSVLRQSVLPLEIIVIDQSDGEDTKKYITNIKNAFKVKVNIVYFYQREKSSVKARNRGISIASGDIISFFDDDVILFEDYLKNIQQCFNDNKLVGGLSGNVIIRNKLQGWKWNIRKILLRLFLLNNFDGRMTISGFGYSLFEREIDHDIQVEMLTGCNMNFRKQLIKNETFDEWFEGYSYREDAEFSYRMSQKFKLIMIPEAKLFHNRSKANRLDIYSQKVMAVKNYYYFYKKHARKNIVTDFLFLYSLAGLCVIFLIEYLNNRNKEKYAQLTGFLKGVSTLFQMGNANLGAKTRKIKVLHIINTLHLGGAEVNLFNLVRTTDANRFEVHIAYSFGGDIEEKFKKMEANLFKYAEGIHKVRSLASIFIVFRLTKYIYRNKIQIIHTHNFNAHVWGSIAAKLTGAKLIEHVHDLRYENPDYLNKRGVKSQQFRFVRYFARFSDVIIVLTENNKKFLLDNKMSSRGRIRVMLNGIDVDHRISIDSSALYRKLNIPENKKIILSAARMSPEKNIKIVLAIAEKIKEKHKDTVFVIAGDGPLKNQLEDIANKKGLNDTVHFIGFYPDIKELLSFTSIFIQPTLLELHSITMLEAMSMRVPVLVSKGVGCNDQFLSYGVNAFLLDPYNIEEWCRIITSLLSDNTLRHSVAANGRKLVEDKCDIRKTIKSIENIYLELVQ